MAIATLEQLKQRFATEQQIKEATALQHLAVWYAFVRSNPAELLYPYGEPAIEFAQRMQMDMRSLQISSLKNNPLICASCGKQIGLLQSGKASLLYGSKHEDCKIDSSNKSLFFLYNMMHIARELQIDYSAFEHHLIIMELEYAKRKQQQASSVANGFEFIRTLSIGQQEQECPHDNSGRDELQTASSCT